MSRTNLAIFILSLQISVFSVFIINRLLNINDKIDQILEREHSDNCK